MLDPPLVSAFHSGFEAEDSTDSGHNIKPNDWKLGQMVSHFMRLVNLDSLQDLNHLEALYTLSREPATSNSGDEKKDNNGLLSMLVTRAMTEDALALAAELATDDEPESEVRRREKEYFDAVGVKRLTIARKLSVAAKINPLFVADRRLWAWVDGLIE